MFSKKHPDKLSGIQKHYLLPQDFTVIKERNSGFYLEISGWCRKIKPEEYLILEVFNKKLMYLVEKVRYNELYPDKFYAKLRIVPSLACLFCKTLYNAQTELELCPRCKTKLV